MARGDSVLSIIDMDRGDENAVLEAWIQGTV
jgi:hypothetical protein